jgi:putative two-component system response regulator
MVKDIEWAYDTKSEKDFVDPVTGFFVYQFFLLELDRELLRSQRSGDPFTVAFLELKDFGNDEEGRSALNEENLREIGSLIRGNIRDVDIACRCSTNLFALLLLKTSAEVAHVAGERIRRAMERHFPHSLSIAAGMVSFPFDASDREGLLRKTMEALRQAKGKQRVYYFTRPTRNVKEEKPSVLVVDDDPRNVKLLESYLLPQGYEVLKTFSGEEALTLVSQRDVDLLLLDIMMPGLDGYQVCKRIKERDSTRFVPVILITALDDLDAKVRGIEVGADDFITKPANREELLARTRALIGVRELNKNLVSIKSALFSLASAVEAKDNYTLGHTQRVASLAESLGKRLQLSEKEISALRIGGILHDVGKIGISEEILNKPGKLNEREWEIMKNHPVIGYRICLPMKSTLGLALDVVRHHHEKLDGSSYPDGLKGEEISLAARIMCVVDIYDALVTERPYRKALTKDKALKILRDEVKTGKLDGLVVDELEDLVL